jgi:pimeloyl-ACP methyl ester carboxylesterase
MNTATSDLKRVGDPSSSARAKVIYSFGGYRIDTARFEITNDRQALAVEPQVLELLITLIDSRDRVVSKDELFEKVWKGRIVSDTTLASRVKTARQLIGDDGTRQEYIKTIHGRGFRFIGEVEMETALTANRDAPKPATFDRPATRYARSGDVHVAYQVFGQGPINMILAPGYVSHIENYWDCPALARWLGQLGALARIAMFDKRGTGLSDPVSTLPSMDERMDDLRAVMDAAKFETAYVMGISEGGSLAALFAAHHPARCEGLILYGAFAQFKHWFPDEESLQRLFDYVESDWGSGESLKYYAPTAASDPEMVRWWGKFERLGATPGACKALMQMNSRIDITGVLPGIRVPALVIHRAGDVLVDVDGGRQLANEIPGARYAELQGDDHLPFVGDADHTIAVISDFVRQPQRQLRSDRVVATIILIHTPAGQAGIAIDQTLRRFRATRVLQRPDGIVATFDGPARALECALSVSRLLREVGQDHRIGVHTGQISVDAEVLEGTAMDVSSDVAGHAGENEILVSRTVNDLVAGSGIVLKDRGEFGLPSIEQVWHLFRVET